MTLINDDVVGLVVDILARLTSGQLTFNSTVTKLELGALTSFVLVRFGVVGPNGPFCSSVVVAVFLLYLEF